MRKVNTTDHKVVRFNARSLSILLPRENVTAYATKRVANELFNGSTDVYLTERIDHRGEAQYWLATPFIFC